MQRATAPDSSHTWSSVHGVCRVAQEGEHAPLRQTVPGAHSPLEAQRSPATPPIGGVAPLSMPGVPDVPVSMRGGVASGVGPVPASGVGVLVSGVGGVLVSGVGGGIGAG